MDAADYISSGQIYCEPLAITMQSWARHARRGIILSHPGELVWRDLQRSPERGWRSLLEGCPIPRGLLGLELESQSSATPG